MYAALNFAGNQPFNDWFAPDTTQRHPLGLRVTAVDEFWGAGEFMYIKSNDAILKGSLVAYAGVSVALGVVTSYLGVLLPSAAGQGFPFGVAMAPMASGTYGWIMLSGTAVYKTSATVAADTVVGIGAAGVVAANSNGKQLVGVRNTVSATGTNTAYANISTGSAAIVCPAGYAGFFLGMALTGTAGIPASTVVAKLDPDGRTIWSGSAIGTVGDKNSTASGSITLTGTYTGYGQGQINNPFAQGAIL
jgi:hypothetical protein